MEERVLNFISSNNLIEKDKRIVVALSGGVDSMVLFSVLRNLGYDIVVAHVNHKIRLESEIEEEYIKKLCAKNNIPLEILHLEKLSGNFEAGAHKKRYEFFINVCHKYSASYLATAHHADDNIETIFMNMMSGSNLYGYGGISKDLLIDDIHVVRPLLKISKADIKAYALKNNITYFEDSTNQSDEYTRNRIRHHIIPILKEECPNILDKSNSYSEQIHEAFDYCRKQSISYLNDNNGKINIKSFSILHSYLKKDVMCLLLEKYNIERNENLINDLLNVTLSKNPQASYDLKGGYIFKKRYNIAYIDSKSSNDAFKLEINKLNEIVENKSYKFYLTTQKPKNAFYIKLCYNEISLPLIIRNRVNGDEIEMTYGHKKLKNLFIDHKMNEEQRNEAPVITDGNGYILWVYNIAKSKKAFKYKDSYDCYLVVEVK